MEKSDDFALGSAAPFGRLQVFEPKDFPYLNTGKSLVFVIARNGMVWGKRLDDQSSKGDIELEVFLLQPKRVLRVSCYLTGSKIITLIL